MGLGRLCGRILILLSFLTGAAGMGKDAIAAEKVVLKYKVFRESILVADLANFAATGEASSALQSYLLTLQQNPEDFRSILTRQTPVNIVTLDRALNSPGGNFLLDQIGAVIHPPAKVASRQALRAALVLSVSQDRKISLIEVIQNYPTPEVEVEGERILKLSRQLSAIKGQ
jgi:Alpha/beta hydrolase of unknown function (DUF1400)